MRTPLDEFAAWVNSMDLAAAHMCTPRVTVEAGIWADSHGTPRAYWRVAMGRFTASLPLMDCICREAPGVLTVCTVFAPELTPAHYGVKHCHAWHPEKVAAYIAYIAKPPRHTPKPPPTVRYNSQRDFVPLEAS